MLVSRRAFLTLLAAVPAMEKVYGRCKLLDNTEFITDPVDIEEAKTEYQPGTYGTNSKIVHGPASIFDVVTSGDGGDCFLVREGGSILLSWSLHHFAIFRWVAAPGSEIWVPEGTHVKLVFTPREDLRLVNKEHQFAPWIIYNAGLVSHKNFVPEDVEAES